MLFRSFGLKTKGTLTVGKDADLNVFNADLTELQATYSMGRRFSKQDGVETKE